MNYATIKPTDIANGTGIRVSLFVSGCRNHCKGCFNPETWDFEYGTPFTFATWDYILGLLKPDYIAGLSVLGGDPLEPENAEALLPFLRRVKEAYPNKTIWMYTGYIYERVWELPLLQYVDVLVDGPFILDKADKRLQFRGSSNQRILDLKHRCGQCGWMRSNKCMKWLHYQESWKVKACWEKEADLHVLLEHYEAQKNNDLYKKLREERYGR